MADAGSVWGRIRGFPWLRIALIYTGIGLLEFTYHSLDQVARGGSPDWTRVLMEELTGMWSGLVITPALAWLTLSYPIAEGRWKRRWPLYLACGIALAFLDTTIIYGMRLIAFAAMGRGRYDYGIMRVRYFMELPSQLIWIATIVTLIAYSEHRRLARLREQRIQMLEREVTQAQLETLQMQLHPHFLFNSLNAISSVVYEDPRVADRMISSLCDFLRRVLRTDKTLEVPLCEELELLELYLCVMRARFEEKLQCTVHADSDLERALVPQLILQPLVENALRYAADPETGSISVSVEARRDGDRLRLEIRDRGPAGESAVSGNGVGLKNLQGRLERLYAEGAQLKIRRAPGEGTHVSIELPFHTEPAALTA